MRVARILWSVATFRADVWQQKKAPSLRLCSPTWVLRAPGSWASRVVGQLRTTLSPNIKRSFPSSLMHEHLEAYFTAAHTLKLPLHKCFNDTKRQFFPNDPFFGITPPRRPDLRPLQSFPKPRLTIPNILKSNHLVAISIKAGMKRNVTHFRPIHLTENVN